MSAPHWTTRRHGFTLQVRAVDGGWEGAVIAGHAARPWARPSMVLRTAAEAERWCRWMADRLAVGAPVGVAA